MLSGPGYEREPRRRAIGSPGLPSQSAHRSRCAVTGDQLSPHFARLSESWAPVSGSHAAGCRLLPTSSDSLVMTLAGVVHRRAASCLGSSWVEPRGNSDFGHALVLAHVAAVALVVRALVRM